MKHSMMMIPAFVALLAKIGSSSSLAAFAFAPSRHINTSRHPIKPPPPPPFQTHKSPFIGRSSSLNPKTNCATIHAMGATSAFARSIPLPTMTPSSIIKAILVSITLVLVAKFRDRIFYPGAVPDPLHSEPLPPGKMGGCPWLGPISFLPNMNKYLSQEATKVHNSQTHDTIMSADEPTRIWKLFTFGKPTAVISGSAKIKQFLNREFKKEGGGVSQMTELGTSGLLTFLFGEESMSGETSDSTNYHTLRRLVGQALTPESVSKGIPFLQICAEEAVDDMLANDTVVMAELLQKLTLDVAWRQIIGLKLNSAEEITKFRSAVKTWSASLTNYPLLFAPLPVWIQKRLSCYKAKMYLNEKIEEKIDELERDGPDGSTMSAMVFATDEEDGKTKLTRQQVIDNIFLLIFAGAETSSNTLTNAMLLLGMHPTVWKKLVKEQHDFVKKHGNTITKEDIDRDCPYLDGVLRETMRLIPISAGGARDVDDTVIIDGVQIPKGWFSIYSPALTHEQDPKTFLEDGSHMDIQDGFKPERWMDAGTRPTTEYIPYGAGHRYCLGHTLATAEMKTFLAVLARKVEGFNLITNTANMKWKEGIILTPKDGVLVATF